jgi:hypothetical protein
MRRQLIPAACVLVAILIILQIWQFWFHKRYHFEGVIVDEQGNQLDGVCVGITLVRPKFPWPKESFERRSIQVNSRFSIDVDIERLDGVSLDFGKQSYDSVTEITPDKSRMVGMKIVLRRQLQWDPPSGDNRTGPLDQRRWPKSVPSNTRVIATSMQPRATTAPVDGTYVLVSKTGEIFSVRRFYQGSEIGFMIEAGNLCSVPSTMGSSLVQDGAPYEWRLYSTATRLPPASTKPAGRENR